ncbi:MAG: hypothetical protein II839_04905 [Kiritimatiellae bacterium]|nr:hypothetical protein [Kiritimatiellia bacterium]MBQ3810141.1 hypothetical protein [Kiritimatiellia bacterium]
MKRLALLLPLLALAAAPARAADPATKCFWHVGDDSYEWHALSADDSARVAALLADFENWTPDPAYGPEIGVCEARNPLRVMSGSGVTNEYSFQMAACENNSFGNCVRRPSGPVRLVPDSVRREFVGLREKWNREIEETLTDRFLDASTIVRYERFSREDGDGETHAVSKAEGDEILALLADWKNFEELRPKPRRPEEPCICAQILHPDLVLSCFRVDGSSKSIKFFRIIDGSTKKTRLDIELPDVRWRRVPDGPARAILAKLDAWTAADRAAFLAVPLPRTYVFGSTGWDGGTLSGVARLFYGNGNKWSVIWEANKDAVPNPNYLTSGTKLVIPALATNAPAALAPHAESAEGAEN